MMDHPLNLTKKAITVKHADLERTGDSPYRSVCPVCEVGTLLVRRDQETLEIVSEDICLLCGQHFIYEDLP